MTNSYVDLKFAQQVLEAEGRAVLGLSELVTKPEFKTVDIDVLLRVGYPLFAML